MTVTKTYDVRGDDPKPLTETDCYAEDWTGYVPSSISVKEVEAKDGTPILVFGLPGCSLALSRKQLEKLTRFAGSGNVQEIYERRDDGLYKHGATSNDWYLVPGQ